MGVLVSTVSQNQGQAIQLAFMIVLPQVLLSGLIFPVSSMAAGVRWISYVLPLTYFIEISRGVMLKAAPISALWEPLGLLALLAVVVLGLAIIRFRRDLAPGSRKEHAAARTPGAGGDDETGDCEDVRVTRGRNVALAGVTVPVDPSRVTVVVGGDGAGKSTCLRGARRAPRARAGHRAPPAEGAHRVRAGHRGAVRGPDRPGEPRLLRQRLPAVRPRVPAEGRRAPGADRARPRAATGSAGSCPAGCSASWPSGMALLHAPELLVLDEPTTGVDPVSRAELWRLISGAAADGTAVAVTTTYVNEAARAASVVLLEAGKVAASGSPAQILRGVPGALGTTGGRRAPDPAVLAAGRQLAGMGSGRRAPRRRTAGGA